MPKTHVKIYHSRLHLFSTLCIVAAPFLFLLFFSRIAHIATGQLLGSLGASFLRLCIAYFFSVIFGWILAVSFYRGKRAMIALPFFDVMQSFPTFAVLPLVAFLWGVSSFTVIFFLVLTIIWPILFSLISSLKLIRNDWEEVAFVYGLSGFNYIRYFLFPVSIPGLVTGSIVGLGEGWEALIATEIIVGLPHGLGGFFQVFSHNIPVTTFGVLGFLIFIFSINKLVWLPLLGWSHGLMEE